jgi:hypothetical protein
VVVFPETVRAVPAPCENGQLLLVRGKFERDEESSRLQANEVSRLDSCASGCRRPCGSV